MGMQQKIEKHWNSSADNYGSIIRRELDSFRRKAWAKKITENAPDKPNLSVLDIGTGPGFFPIVLGELGHNVMAIDCTENMLEKAKKLAQSEDITADFLKMDSHALSFEDNTFDLLINRNVTWTLYDPEKAYKEWYRVLKQGGRLLIFDANWLLGYYREDIRKQNQENEKLFHEKYGSPWETGGHGDESHILSLPMGKVDRPEWDKQYLEKIGFQVTYEKSVIDELWGEDEKLIYGATPMFMIVAEKPLSSSGYLLDNIQKYWDMRSETYSIQNREELMTEQNKWIDKILPRLPQKKNMRILDIGCGPGFFSIMMAQHGYQVTGIDYSEQMLMHALENAKDIIPDIADSITFRKMDAQNLEFEDNSFDVILSRNLTWGLEHPVKAYQEWLRVLCPGGKILNFDGNHYLHCFREDYSDYQNINRQLHQQEYLKNVDMSTINRLAMELPLSRLQRPQWDVITLLELGVKGVEVEAQEWIVSAPEKGKKCIASFLLCITK